MLTRVLCVLAATLTGVSIGDARQNTTTMTCGEAAATVARAGAIVLMTGDHTYDRFVATAASCLPGQITAPGTAPTTDSRACQIGYICKQRDND